VNQKLALKEARTSFKEARKAFKSALDEGSLSQDEVKDKAMEVINLAAKLEEISEDIVEGVTVEGDTETIDNGAGENTTENNIPDKVVQTAGLHNNDDETNKRIAGLHDDDKDLERDNKIAQLEKDNKDMKEAQIKQDLSLKYAQLFPEPMRQAQIKAFMSHKEGPRILEARLDEATVLLSKQTTSHYKQAQIESPFTFDDSNVESDNNVEFGSVI